MRRWWRCLTALKGTVAGLTDDGVEDDDTMGYSYVANVYEARMTYTDDEVGSDKHIDLRSRRPEGEMNKMNRQNLGVEVLYHGQMFIKTMKGKRVDRGRGIQPPNNIAMQNSDEY